MTAIFLGLYYLMVLKITVCSCDAASTKSRLTEEDVHYTTHMKTYQIITGNSTLYFENGSTARLVCPLISDTVTWTGPPNRILLAAGEMVYKDQFSVLKNRTHFTLQIITFNKEHKGKYVCETLKEDFCFFVDMLKAPSNMTIENKTSNGCIYGYADREMILKCKVNSGTPRGTMYWKHNNTVVAKNQSSSLTFSFRPSAANDLEEFSCVANNSLTLQQTIKICLIYPPKVQITPSLNVVEGTHVELECIYSVKNNMTTNSWAYDENKIWKWFNLSKVVLGSINRSQAGDYACTVEHRQWTTSANLTIEVLYPPEVSVTYDDRKRELKCTAAGVPNRYDFNNWKQKTEFGDFLRNLKSTKNGTVSIPNITNETSRHFDRGIYVCNVSNNISAVDGKTYVLSEYWLNTTGKPYFVTSNMATQYGILKQITEVRVDIVSFTKLIDATLFTDEICIRNHSLINHLRVEDTIYGKKVLVQGMRLNFPIDIKSNFDFRSYNVVVNNTHGSSHYTINLSSARRPEPPFIIHCLPRKNDIAITWKPGFNGGYKQNVFVEFRSKQDESWRILTASEDKTNTTTTFITNPEPGTEYFIRMFSKNKIESSDYTGQCMVKTETNRVGVIIVLFLISLALIFMSCLLYQYKTGKLKDIRNSSCIRFIQVIRDGIAGVENDMYEMQNNIHQQQQAQDDNPEVPVYSSIDRRHQLSIGSTVSYSVTKKKKPNPVWHRKGQKGDELKKKNHSEIPSSNEIGKQDLNYIEVRFDQQTKDFPFKIHGLEHKTDYIDIDFTKKVDKPPDSDTDDISDDGFASAEVVKSMKRKTKNLNF